MRIVVAEDNLLVRRGLVTVIEEAGEHEVVAACDSLSDLLRAVDDVLPDAVVTDIRMPPHHTDEGVRAAVELRHRHPDVGVVLLSQHLDARYALDLIADGSQGRGYLLKERIAEPGQLARALAAVVSGDSFIDSEVIDALLARRRASESPVNRLTDREREVLAEIASGRNNQTIASALFISDRAVEKHINSIFTKLDLREAVDVDRRVAAVLMYLSSTS